MSPALPDGYQARPATLEDLDAVVGVIETVDRSLGVPADPVRDELSWLWHLPSTDLGRDARVVTLEGDIVAYAAAISIHPEEEGPTDVIARVHPAHHGAGIGTALASWNETVAHERTSGGVRTYVVDRDAAAHALLRSRGYAHVRSAFTMCRALTPDEDRGTDPDGVTIRSYRDSDERVLHELHEAAFADHWGFQPTAFETWNEALRGEGWDPSLVWLAEARDTPVGYLVAIAFETCGFVAILGVLREWRGRGIGTALLHRSFAELARRGQPEVRLTVDALNISGAVQLYERAGMTVCRRYDNYDLGTEDAERASRENGTTVGERGAGSPNPVRG
jgi:mycothiol synthase